MRSLAETATQPMEQSWQRIIRSRRTKLASGIVACTLTLAACSHGSETAASLPTATATTAGVSPSAAPTSTETTLPSTPTFSPTPTPTPTPTPDMTTGPGSRGKRVKEDQTMVFKVNCAEKASIDGKISGEHDPTIRGVNKAQRTLGLAETPYIDNAVRALLKPSADTGEALCDSPVGQNPNDGNQPPHDTCDFNVNDRCVMPEPTLPYPCVDPDGDFKTIMPCIYPTDR